MASVNFPVFYDRLKSHKTLSYTKKKEEEEDEEGGGGRTRRNWKNKKHSN